MNMLTGRPNRNEPEFLPTFLSRKVRSHSLFSGPQSFILRFCCLRSAPLQPSASNTPKNVKKDCASEKDVNWLSTQKVGKNSLILYAFGFSQKLNLFLFPHHIFENIWCLWVKFENFGRDSFARVSPTFPPININSVCLFLCENCFDFEYMNLG